MKDILFFLFVAIACCCIWGLGMYTGKQMQKHEQTYQSGYARLHSVKHKESESLIYHPGITCSGISEWKKQQRDWNIQTKRFQQVYYQ